LRKRRPPKAASKLGMPTKGVPSASLHASLSQAEII